LYEFAESDDITVVAEALQGIQRIIAHHRRRCRVADESTSDLSAWLDGHVKAYYTALSQLAVCGIARSEVLSVRLFIVAVREDASEAKAAGADVDELVSARVRTFLWEVLLAEKFGKAAECLFEEFVAQYADVRHAVLKAIQLALRQVARAGGNDVVASKLAQNVDDLDERAAKKARKNKNELPFVLSMQEQGIRHDVLFGRILKLLKLVPTPDPSNSGNGSARADGDACETDVQVLAVDGRGARYYMKDYKKTYQLSWVSLFGLRVPLEHCRPLLQYVPTNVMPNMSNPLLLSDFYLNAFGCGNKEVAVLSLSGLFLLLTQHGLGDPDSLTVSGGEYFARLYELLSPDVFQLKSRVRFQRLVATSLNSALLPARLAAAFAKRCMRLALSAAGEPGTTMWLIAVAYSLLQKHHSHCKTLLHQAPANSDEDVDVSGDSFDVSAPLEQATHQVLKSSLWEVQLLRRHHVPQVNTLVSLFLKEFWKPSAKKLDSDDFLAENTVSLYGQALKSASRQLERMETKGTTCPLAFQIEGDDLDARIVGWAACLSTEQRKLGAES